MDDNKKTTSNDGPRVRPQRVNLGPATVDQDIVLSPRVVDEQALNRYTDSLREMLQSMSKREQGLGDMIQQSQHLLAGLESANATYRERLVATEKLMAAIAQQSKALDETIAKRVATAKEIADARVPDIEKRCDQREQQIAKQADQGKQAIAGLINQTLEKVLGAGEDAAGTVAQAAAESTSREQDRLIRVAARLGREIKDEVQAETATLLEKAAKAQEDLAHTLSVAEATDQRVTAAGDEAIRVLSEHAERVHERMSQRIAQAAAEAKKTIEASLNAQLRTIELRLAEARALPDRLDALVAKAMDAALKRMQSGLAGAAAKATDADIDIAAEPDADPNDDTIALEHEAADIAQPQQVVRETDERITALSRALDSLEANLTANDQDDSTVSSSSSSSSSPKIWSSSQPDAAGPSPSGSSTVSSKRIATSAGRSSSSVDADTKNA